MKDVRKFLGILKIELEDVQDDIASMIEALGERLQRGECTEYVCKENTALYRTEIDSLHDFLKEIDGRSAQYGTAQEAADDILKLLPEKVKTWNYPKFMINLIERKVRMILGFMNDLE
jgi:hypothetical protein